MNDVSTLITSTLDRVKHVKITDEQVAKITQLVKEKNITLDLINSIGKIPKPVNLDRTKKFLSAFQGGLLVPWFEFVVEVHIHLTLNNDSLEKEDPSRCNFHSQIEAIWDLPWTLLNPNN